MIENKDLINLEDNKYFRWYWNICENAKNRELLSNTYIEKHHVYPTSIFGFNNYIVKLTAKEHYIVHKLLWIGLRNKLGFDNKHTRKMAHAFTNMTRNSKFLNRDNNGAKDYNYIKQAYYESMIGRTFSEDHRKKLSQSHIGNTHTEQTKKKLSELNSGDKHPQFGTKHSEDTIKNMSKPRSERARKNMSESHKGKEPWNKGKKGLVPWNKGLKKGTPRPDKPINQYDLKGNFIKTFNSIKQAIEITGIKSIAKALNGQNKSAGGYIWKFNI